MRPRVYVCQRPGRKVQGVWVDAFDMSSAERFGELTFLIGYGNPPVDPVATVRVLRRALSAYRSTDFLLPVGDPTLIASACGIASLMTGGFISVLRWDRRAQEYHPVRLNLLK